MASLVAAQTTPTSSDNAKQVTTQTLPDLPPASMITPDPNSALPGPMVTFNWKLSPGATRYALYVGAQAGGRQYFSYEGTKTTASVEEPLPTDGRTMYVRLYTFHNQAAQYNDYIYTAIGPGGNDSVASIITPAPNSPLPGAAFTFSWSAIADAQFYTLDLGTHAGSMDIARLNPGLNTGVSVSNFPVDGRLIYVRLWTNRSSGWQFIDYIYPSYDGPLYAGCSCSDIPRLKDRLEKLRGVELLIANKLQSTAAQKPATQHEWGALQSEIRGYLQAMQIQALTAFADTSLFNGNDDPFCGKQPVSAGACLDQDFAVHQIGHSASCSAGNWNWQIPWTEQAMLQEEGTTIEKESDSIRETIKHLGCDLPPGSVTASGTPPVQTSPSGLCPQFMVTVQNVTTSSINMSGLNAQSGRSLNNGEGINVPLVFHPDGTFEGYGSGTDSGSAAGAIPGETVHSQFGHMQAIQASGSIRPGGCTTKPCQPDVMHLILLGGPSQQMVQAQAQGQVNRNMQQTTPTGAARLEFDLPAYVGGSAQKIFFSTPILNSGMTVMLLQANNNTPALPQGGSLLYSLQQCKSGPRGGGPSGSGGTSGIVIPGLEGVPATPTSKSTPGNNIGMMIPGLENGIPVTKSSQIPAVIQVDEKIHTADAVPFNQGSLPAMVTIDENVRVTDTVPVTPSAVVNLSEGIRLTDTTSPSPSVSINMNESVHMGDSDAPSPAAVINLKESLHVGDANTPTAANSPPKLQNPKIGHP